MKKLVKWCAVALLVAVAAMAVIYRAVNTVPSADLPLNAQVYEIFEEGGCLSCHSADPKLPFYAKLPIAGDIVMKDIDSGYRAYDMTKFMENLAVGNQVDLSIWQKSRRWFWMTACLCQSIILCIGEARLLRRKGISC